MNGETGFFYLNEAGEWPKFELPEATFEIGTDGSLTLARTDGNTFIPRGVFRGGLFEGVTGLTPWFRLRVHADPLPEGAHVQLFTSTADDGDAPYDPTAERPFTGPGWKAAPRDELDILIPNPPARRLWIGGILRSDGQASPVLHQMRVDYGRDTYLQFLPAIYGESESKRDLLERYLALHESVLGGLEQAIAGLPRLFDPLAAPDKKFPSWLSWLAGWLDFDLNEAWGEAKTRDYLVQAFHLYGQRGTVEGLRRYLKWYAGVEAHIEEPGLHTHLWSLGETSTLGFTTMLAPAQLQGAVVGTSATLDQSHLTQGEDFGAVLFEDLAHRFCVQVYCAELIRPGALEDVRAVIEREKPAHTDYHLRVIEPRMRVGVQARVGIDAIIAQGPPAARFGMPLDTGVLAAESGPCKAGPSVPDGELKPCREEERI
jgi:phage tail-like protein